MAIKKVKQAAAVDSPRFSHSEYCYSLWPRYMSFCLRILSVHGSAELWQEIVQDRKHWTLSVSLSILTGLISE